MSSYYNHSANDVLLTIEKKVKAEESEKVPKANTIDKDNQKITKVNRYENSIFR